MSASAVVAMNAGQALCALLQAGKSIRRASWTDGITLQPGGERCLFKWSHTVFHVTLEERCTGLGEADLYATDWEVVS